MAKTPKNYAGDYLRRDGEPVLTDAQKAGVYYSGRVALEDAHGRTITFEIHGGKLLVTLPGHDRVAIEIHVDRLGPFSHEDLDR